MGGVSTPPVYRGSYRETVGLDFPYSSPDMGWGRHTGHRWSTPKSQETLGGKKMPLKLKVFVCLAFQSKLQTCVAPRNKKWRKGKIILNGGFIVVSCILNRMLCHQFRWWGTRLIRRDMKWVLSRWNHMCTGTNSWWVLELNVMRAFEIANMK